MAKKPNEKELTEKTKKRIQKLLKKGHSPEGAKFVAKQKTTAWSKPKKMSLADQGIVKRLRKAGLTEAEIRKLHK